MNPNSANQRWSLWTFEINEAGHRVSKAELQLNIARWLRAGFGSAGKARLSRTQFGWRIECLVEGPDAHDPAYVQSVRHEFQHRFVAQGWGPLAIGTVSVKLLAGSDESGRSPAQLLILEHPNG